jgi:hypothetical protein
VSEDRQKQEQAAVPVPEERKLPVVAEAEPPVVCRKLRTKTAFGSMQPGAHDWRHGDSTTAVYWCLVTMETAGADDGLAHPHACGVGRSCFVPPADWEGSELRS